MQVAAAAAAVGRQVPAVEASSLGARSVGSDEELTRRGLEPTSPPAGDRMNRTADDDEDDAMSALSCVESDDTASPDCSPAGMMALTNDAASQRRAAADMELMAS